MSTTYKVLGPMTIDFDRNSHGTKLISKQHGLASLSECEMSQYRGCYVFSIRGAKGSIRPYYVGRSAVSFADEAFTSDKINKYNAVLHRVTHGTPIMLFVVPESSKGKFADKPLAALEQYLIALAYQVNDDIQNVQGIPTSVFAINGVQVPKKGPKGESLIAFSKAFGLR